MCSNITLLDEPIKCSKECTAKGIDCEAQKHKINFKQFEGTNYQHAGKIKKKLSLVDKTMLPSEFRIFATQKLLPFIFIDLAQPILQG